MSADIVKLLAFAAEHCALVPVLLGAFHPLWDGKMSISLRAE